ncbi:MAG: hypothetical protein R3F59_19710 [Myxococcota bacterium]
MRAALTASAVRRPLVARFADGDVVPSSTPPGTVAAGLSMTLDLADPARPGPAGPPPSPSTAAAPAYLVARAATRRSGWDPAHPARRPAAGRGHRTAGFEAPTGDETLFLGGFGAVNGALAARVALGERVSLGALLRRAPALWPSACRRRCAARFDYGAAIAVRPVPPVALGAELFGGLGLRASNSAGSPLEVSDGALARGPPRVAGRRQGGGLGRRFATRGCACSPG